MSEIPASWLECTLGDVVDYGATKKAEPSEIPPDAWVLELEDIEKDTSRILTRATFRERGSKSTKNKFKNGDVLYGKLRPYLNKVVRATQDGFCTTEIVPLSPTELVAGDYLFHWLKHPRFLDYVSSVSHGLNMPRLGTEAGRKAPFVLAPLNEQKRIADKLDSLLARVDACRERLDHIPTILKRLRQSILAAASSGKLTAEWREAQSNPSEAFADRLAVGNLDRPPFTIPSDWRWTSLDSLCNKITDGEHLTPTRVDAGVPILSAKDVRENDIDFSDAKFVTADTAEKSRQRCNPERGDILVVSRGATIGRTCRVTTDTMFCLMGSVLLFKPKSNIVLPHIIEYCFKTPTGLGSLISRSGATAQQAIYIRDMRTFPVPVPPMSEQHEIVRRVETLLAFVDEVETRLTNAQTHVNRLTPASLSKAFRGELVPQNPNDEPAEDLLKRIKLTKESEVFRPRERKSGKRISKRKATDNMLKRSELQSNHLTEILRSNGSLTAEALWAASQLEIDDFYDQLKAEEDKGLLKERRKQGDGEVRLLEVA